MHTQTVPALLRSACTQTHDAAKKMSTMGTQWEMPEMSEISFSEDDVGEEKGDDRGRDNHIHYMTMYTSAQKDIQAAYTEKSNTALRARTNGSV